MLTFCATSTGLCAPTLYTDSCRPMPAPAPPRGSSRRSLFTTVTPSPASRVGKPRSSCRGEVPVLRVRGVASGLPKVAKTL